MPNSVLSVVVLASTGCCPAGREEPNHSSETEASADLFLLLGPACPIRPPNILMPALMNNHGDYIFSLGNFCHWLAGKAEG